MKLSILKLSPILLIPCLSACAPLPTMTEKDCVSVGAVFQCSSNQLSYSCESCDGTIIYKFKLIHGQSSLVVKGIVHVTSGSISMSVEDDKGMSFYVADFDEYGDIDFAVAEFRTHILVVKHTNFKGSYKLNWAH